MRPAIENVAPIKETDRAELRRPKESLSFDRGLCNRGPHDEEFQGAYELNNDFQKKEGLRPQSYQARQKLICPYILYLRSHDCIFWHCTLRRSQTHRAE